MIISDCCGAPANGNEDYGICPDCKEHCEWEEDDIDEEENSESNSDQMIDIMNNEKDQPC
jgi:hypothetical protein